MFNSHRKYNEIIVKRW